MPRDTFQPLLYRYLCFCAGAVLFLICVGGVVTSENAGMSVPDYPTSYGYNMFLFPWKDMTGGIFWEHGHRLIATGVGVLMIGVAVWCSFQNRRATAWLGWGALALCIVQGMIGGLRVLLGWDWMGIPHAMLSQFFFGGVVLLALLCSKWWLDPATAFTGKVPFRLTRWTLAITILIYTQLGLGASMRHQHDDLAVTDFPTAYGQPWPKVDPASVVQYNKERAAKGLKATTAPEIHLQMTHRVMAVLIFLGILAIAFRLACTTHVSPALLRTGMVWLALVFTQFMLGMFVIWTNKAADVATTHVAVGALTFITGILITAQAWRLEVAQAKSPIDAPLAEAIKSPQLQPAA